MNRLRRIFLRLYLLFANSKAEAELEREIAAHLALLEDEYLRRGMSPQDARLAANCASTSLGLGGTPVGIFPAIHGRCARQRV